MSTKKRKEIAEQEPLQSSEESEEEEVSEDAAEFGDLEDENEDEDENAFVSQSESDDSMNDDEVDDKLLEEVNKPAGPVFYEDSSEEEWDDLEKNRVGRIPMKFYDEYDHIGYNLEGKRVAKPQGKDEVDKLLAKEDDPNYWRTVRDVVGQRDVVLDKEEYELIKSLVTGKYPLGYNPYEPFEETPYEDAAHPLVSFPTRKDDFRPLSKWDRIKIRKLVHAIKQGWIKIGDEQKKEGPRFYDIWNEQNDEPRKKLPEYLFAPKVSLPTHSASYNPPPEYLLSEQEKKTLMNKDFEERKIDYIPQKYRALRAIPAYSNLQQERFYRCLDLYLAPRIKGKAPKVENPEELLPQMRDPETLRPFPSIQTMIFEGHLGKVRSISIDPTGQWLLSGSDDNTARIFEIQTGRCHKVIKTDGIVYNVAWNPDPQKSIIAISTGERVLIIDSLLGNEAQKQTNQEFLSKGIEDTESACIWVRESGDQGIHYSIKHEKPVKHLNWHQKGDYLIAVSPDSSPKNSIIVHQLSLRKSQCPFKKQKGQVQYASFHPTKPLLFVATQLHIKRYNLAQMKLEQKLLPSSKWISCFDVHPSGDHVVMGGYDKKVCWFDLDLSTKPYKVLKYHKFAIRKVTFHKRYPLFASCSDDLSVHIFHGMVFNDLLQNPYIQPLKVLKGHQQVDQLGVLDIQFHPTQPWIFSAGSDSTIRLFT